ncbi:MAG: hypothetical protein GC151_03320 [Betaproteobacteria bacterium]|nr:hypothetical protein [Betaproteobacteria bacterium]
MRYDEVGNVASFTDPRGGVTSYTWDAKNRLITRTDALTHAESFVYDDADNLVSHTDRKGQVTACTYDELNRRTQTTRQGGATTSYTFDAGDRLTQVTDSVSGTTSRTRDNRFDALASETVPLDVGTSTTGYVYGTAAGGTRMQVSRRTEVTTTCDDGNRISEVMQGRNALSPTK